MCSDLHQLGNGGPVDLGGLTRPALLPPEVDVSVHDVPQPPPGDQAMHRAMYKGRITHGCSWTLDNGRLQGELGITRRFRYHIRWVIHLSAHNWGWNLEIGIACTHQHHIPGLGGERIELICGRREISLLRVTLPAGLSTRSALWTCLLSSKI